MSYRLGEMSLVPGGFLKPKSRANLELFSSYSPTLENGFIKQSWRFQNPQLENNSGINQDINIFSTTYSPTYSD